VKEILLNLLDSRYSCFNRSRQWSFKVTRLLDLSVQGGRIAVSFSSMRRNEYLPSKPVVLNKNPLE